MSDCFDEFVESLNQQELSKSSRMFYTGDIRDFTEYLKRKGISVESVDEEIIKDYLLSKKIKLSTANRRISSIRRFGSFLRGRGIPFFQFDSKPSKKLGLAKLVSTKLANSSDVDAVISGIKDDEHEHLRFDTNYEAIRDYLLRRNILIVVAMYECGYGPALLSSLDIDDFSVQEKVGIDSRHFFF